MTWAEIATGTRLINTVATLANEVATAATTEKKSAETRIGLSINEHLDTFVVQTKSLAFPDWPQGTPTESTPAAYSAAITTMGLTIPNISFHMNVSAKNGGYIFDPVNAASRPNSVTMAEFETVYRLFKNKTTFYEKSGSIYKEIKDIDKLVQKRGYKK